jgi:hypothetical protein
VEEAREAARGAVAVVADREDWFEDREFLEILLARLQFRDGLTGEAERRLERAAEVLSSFDVYPWAVVELERVRMLLERDPDASRTLLESVASAMTGVQSSLERELRELEEILTRNSFPAPVLQSRR